MMLTTNNEALNKSTLILKWNPTSWMWYNYDYKWSEHVPAELQEFQNTKNLVFQLKGEQ